MPTHYVFRAVGLPADATISDFSHLRQFVKEDETLQLVDSDQAIVPSCPHDDTVTGLFGVSPPLPKFLEELRSGSEESFAFSLRGEDVEIDLNFYGFTQMYHTSPERPIVADVVAIHGLNGHAYGSWKGKGNLQRMWLRHFFSQDFPNCRTMTYGYNSNLKSKAVYTILDYSREFLGELKSLRTSEEEVKRPLIFIGHSFGGILLAHTLVKARFEVTNIGRDCPLDFLLKSTYGIIFFGTPHRGMLIKNLVETLEISGRTQWKELLEEIQQNSKTLEMELRRFVDLCDGFQIYSFYEIKQTPEVVIGEGGGWKRGEQYTTAVRDNSAILQLPKSLETPEPVEANHSDITKFETSRSKIYRKVHRAMNGMVSKAPEVVASRFRTTAKLPTHFIVPFSKNGNFVGRSTKLFATKNRLAGTGAGGHQRLALCGLDGVGKTRDVLDYIYQYKDQVPVFWINAGSTERFTQDYRMLASKLELPGHDDEKIDVRPIVKDWFENSENGNWIIVLNNADNALDFYPNEGSGLAQFIPHGPNGTIIMTTRDSSLADKLCDANAFHREDELRGSYSDF